MENAGIISIGLEALEVGERDGEIIIPIVRTGGSEGEISVDYTLKKGSASKTDYSSEPVGTLTFLSGETEKEIIVGIEDDSDPETNENFGIAIGNAIGTDLGQTRTADITIVDDDAAKITSLAFGESEYIVDEAEKKAAVEVIRTGESDRQVSVDYSTLDNYAKVGADYLPALGTLTFEPGETSKTFTVPILDDELPELDEALNLTLSNPVGIELGPQKNAQLTIEDNDDSPYTFTEEVVASGLGQVTAFDWTPKGTMLIAERGGVVRMLGTNGLLEEPFIDISEIVNKTTQRGLLGLAIHPEFPTNPYVYLAFTYDPPGVETDEPVGRATRLIRVKADPKSNYTTAVPGSEVTLLETPLINNFHAAGAIRFGNDGSLFFSHGDGFPVGNPANVANTELLQSLDNPLGKLLRINPITGEGYADNPFYDEDLDSNQSKVYSYGLRNPWRYSIHPETGEPFIGDVGWGDYEEINTGKGANFGWPLYEGGNGESIATRAYDDDPKYQELYDNISEVTAPIYARSHEYGGDSILVGDFYQGTTYPELYDGALFFTDYYSNQVDAVLFDEQGNVDSISPLLEKPRDRGTTQVSVGPDDNLYLSDLETGEVSRWLFQEEQDLATENVYGFFQEDLGVHFYTSEIKERDYIIKNMPELSPEGTSFLGVSELSAGQNNAQVKPVYRFLNNSNGDRLFTIEEREKEVVSDMPDYTAEDIAYYAYETEQEGTIPVYRLYNSVEGTHLYTPSVDERNDLLENESNYQLEGNAGNQIGIAFYVYPVLEG